LKSATPPAVTAARGSERSLCVAVCAIAILETMLSQQRESPQSPLLRAHLQRRLRRRKPKARAAHAAPPAGAHQHEQKKQTKTTQLFNYPARSYSK
jgi:hypothetical protein